MGGIEDQLGQEDLILAFVYLAIGLEAEDEGASPQLSPKIYTLLSHSQRKASGKLENKSWGRRLMLQFSMLWSAKLVKLRSHKLHYERRRGVTVSLRRYWMTPFLRKKGQIEHICQWID